MKTMGDSDWRIMHALSKEPSVGARTNFHFTRDGDAYLIRCLETGRVWRAHEDNAGIHFELVVAGAELSSI